MKVLKFKESCVLGTIRIYPDCDNTTLLQTFLGNNSRGQLKTFTEYHLEILKQLGYKITLEKFKSKEQRPKRIWKEQQNK